jgi:hypothetical protein
MTTEDKIPLIAIYPENSDGPDGVVYHYRVVANMLCTCCQQPINDELCKNFAEVVEYLQKRFHEFKPNELEGWA